MSEPTVTIPARLYDKLIADALRLQEIVEDTRNASFDEEEGQSIVSALGRRKRALESEIAELKSTVLGLESFVEEKTREIASDIVKDMISKYGLCVKDLKDGDDEN